VRWGAKPGVSIHRDGPAADQTDILRALRGTFLGHGGL
jgi:hypothetical protein